MDISSLTIFYTCFDISSVHPEQKEAIDSVLVGKMLLSFYPRDLVIPSFYQSIAWLSQKPKALVLVVSRLIALMRNEVSTLTEKGMKAACIGDQDVKGDNDYSWQSRGSVIWEMETNDIII